MAKYIEKESAVNYPVMPKKYRKYPTMNLDDAYEQGWLDLEDLLEKLPTADIPRWIPVTERLPEKNGRYLITGKRGTVYSLEYEDERWYGGIQPIAWMPLPEPYKYGEEE